MKQVYVKEYTRDDGTKVRSHYRNIEETVSRLSQGDNQGALDMISQTLATLPDEQNALAKVVAGNTIVPEEYNGYLGQLQDLNQFQNLAMKYKMLSDNELDVSEAADEIQNAFGEKFGVVLLKYIQLQVLIVLNMITSATKIKKGLKIIRNIQS